MARFTVFCLIVLLISAATAAEIAEAPNAGRKLGKHHVAAAPSPAAEALGEGESAEEEVMERKHRHHHHDRSFEESVVGGVAVVGVLAAVFLTAVFCYIRATRRRPPVQPASPTDSSSSKRKMIASGSPVVK
ncbi:uncharacterized protein LOC131022915 [Salvia miltiorrhiza]|uniref:uncharacterized protein LOC131022915 n=1 Tax=Salvia miltiorrhiza TaxID=226208 RepID=UPI0025AD946F|nr:uncharacterized protein LOC131022915 [Salvia miltiorrhiza]